MTILVPDIKRFFSRLFSHGSDRSATPEDLFTHYIIIQLTENSFAPITFREQSWPPIVSSFTNEPFVFDQNHFLLITFKKFSSRFAKMALIKKPYANKSGICLIKNIKEGIENTYTITISFSNTDKEFTVALKK